MRSAVGAPLATLGYWLDRLATYYGTTSTKLVAALVYAASLVWGFGSLYLSYEGGWPDDLTMLVFVVCLFACLISGNVLSDD